MPTFCDRVPAGSDSSRARVLKNVAARLTVVGLAMGLSACGEPPERTFQGGEQGGNAGSAGSGAAAGVGATGGVGASDPPPMS